MPQDTNHAYYDDLTGTESTINSAPPPPPRSKVTTWLEKAALNTPPAFFSMNMGTGITSILLHNYPYHARWLEYLGTIVFVLNVALFVLLLGATIARYTVWRGVWSTVAKHNVAGMFWGCFPMGFATIVVSTMPILMTISSHPFPQRGADHQNMICYVCVPVWGQHWAYVAYVLWWFDVLASIASNLGMLLAMFTLQTHTVASLAPTWLLPIVACVVAAASGGVVAQTLAPFDPALARSTLFVSWAVWGSGVPIALMVIALLIYRFASGGPPAAPALASVFLPLGPCGQGSFGIVMLGVVTRSLAYQYNTSMIPVDTAEAALRIADAIYAVCLITGLVLWGLALAWYTLGVAMFLDGLRKDKQILSVGKFGVGLWALTFPIGVWATSTIVIAQELNSPAFKVIAAFISTQVIVHWLYVATFTVWKLLRGELFNAPELAGVEVHKRWERVRDVEEGYGSAEDKPRASDGTVTSNESSAASTR